MAIEPKNNQEEEVEFVVESISQVRNIDATHFRLWAKDSVYKLNFAIDVPLSSKSDKSEMRRLLLEEWSEYNRRMLKEAKNENKTILVGDIL